MQHLLKTDIRWASEGEGKSNKHAGGYTNPWYPTDIGPLYVEVLATLTSSHFRHCAFLCNPRVKDHISRKRFRLMPDQPVQVKSKCDTYYRLINRHAYAKPRKSRSGANFLYCKSKSHLLVSQSDRTKMYNMFEDGVNRIVHL